MNHKHFEDMVALYAVGAMDSPERLEFEEHLQSGCSVCQGLLQDFQETVNLLPHGLPPTDVPPHLKSQIMERISEVPPQESKQKIEEKASGFSQRIREVLFPPRLSPTFSVLLLIILAGTGYYALSLQSQLEGEVEQRRQVAEVLDETVARMALLRQQITTQEQIVQDLRKQQNEKRTNVEVLKEQLNQGKNELEQLRIQLAKREEETAFLHRTLEQKDNVVRLLLSPNVVVVSLEGLEQSPGSAFLLFDPQRGSGLFYSFNLPALPRGKVYQLWAIVDKPRSIGTFGLDRGRKGRMLIKNLTNFSNITKFAVSMEPEGGRPQPTGTIHLMGDV